MSIVFHTQQLTAPDQWETVSIDTTPEDAFRALVEYMERTDSWNFRTVMAEQEGTEEVKRAIVVEMIRGSDADGPYFWAQCAVNCCIFNVHYTTGHGDYTGHSWEEDIPLVEIQTPYRVS